MEEPENNNNKTTSGEVIDPTLVQTTVMGRLMTRKEFDVCSKHDSCSYFVNGFLSFLLVRLSIVLVLVCTHSRVTVYISVLSIKMSISMIAMISRIYFINLSARLSSWVDGCFQNTKTFHILKILMSRMPRLLCQTKTFASIPVP